LVGWWLAHYWPIGFQKSPVTVCQKVSRNDHFMTIDPYIMLNYTTPWVKWLDTLRIGSRS
jgi:hypothetical protein